MAIRKEPLIEGQYYHIFNRSIAGYKIFNNDMDFRRFINAMVYYISPKIGLKFSKYLMLSHDVQNKIISDSINEMVDIISFCLMPTHFHLILKQNVGNGITYYIGNLENSYSKYLNIKYKRKGPLWESKFKNIRVKNDAQLLHLTRYIHLNPTSAGIVDKPQDWQWSSYHEYLSGEEKICKYKDVINISPKEYKDFVMDRKDYQRELSKIKSILIDSYAG